MFRGLTFYLLGDLPVLYLRCPFHFYSSRLYFSKQLVIKASYRTKMTSAYCSLSWIDILELFSKYLYCNMRPWRTVFARDGVVQGGVGNAGNNVTQIDSGL